MSYKTVKYCNLCKKKFFIPKGERKTYYCPECMEKVRREMNQEEKE